MRQTDSKPIHKFHILRLSPTRTHHQWKREAKELDNIRRLRARSTVVVEGSGVRGAFRSSPGTI